MLVWSTIAVFYTSLFSNGMFLSFNLLRILFYFVDYFHNLNFHDPMVETFKMEKGQRLHSNIVGLHL